MNKLAVPRTSRRALLAFLRERGRAADAGETDLGPDIEACHRGGLLEDLVAAASDRGDILRAVTLLRRLGRASLSVGRLVEGHVNALILIRLHGTPLQRRAAEIDAADGALFGVWGANGRVPVVAQNVEDGRARLAGGKTFCSGLGLVSRAVLMAGTGGDVQMFLADVSDVGRGDPSSWQVSGMRATASGRYDFDGADAETLGGPGDLLREPHFEGGTWRYAALHCGGLEALAEEVRQHLIRRGQDGDPHQAHRLAHLIRRADLARLAVESAARSAVDAQDAAQVDLAVARTLLARETVEAACVEGMAIADRATGTAGFAAGSPVDRIRRDLGLFLRQANLDGKLTAASRALLDAPAVVGEMW
jgi:hypothetical protein